MEIDTLSNYEQRAENMVENTMDADLTENDQANSPVEVSEDVKNSPENKESNKETKETDTSVVESESDEDCEEVQEKLLLSPAHSDGGEPLSPVNRDLLDSDCEGERDCDRLEEDVNNDETEKAPVTEIVDNNDENDTESNNTTDKDDDNKKDKTETDIDKENEDNCDSLKKDDENSKDDENMLNETWLTGDINNCELQMFDYNIHRKDRSLSTSIFSRGGGVLIAVSKTISSTVLLASNSVEHLFVKVEVGSNKVIIATAYFPPRSEPEKYWEFTDNVEKLSEENPDHKLCILGDFNVPYCNWSKDGMSSDNILDSGR
uniref:Probable ATP-dependent helicase PF08_0048 n=1 Tax=Diabrotica virgifera virgifera TaxID=50390 RepID=A0A6P7GYL1_DIAVI